MMFAVAVISLLLLWTTGYLFGRRSAEEGLAEPEVANSNLWQAERVAREMEQIVSAVRRELARHRASVSRFQERIDGVRWESGEEAARQLFQEVKSVLEPTRRLGQQISEAYDSIRKQSSQLQKIGEHRNKSLEGVLQRWALREMLDDLCEMQPTEEQPLAVVALTIDRFRYVSEECGRSYGDQLITELTELLLQSVRGTDLVAKSGDEEFVIVLPHTPLSGARRFAQRLRRQAAARLPVSISCGLAEAMCGDTAHTLLARAELALYRAQVAGRDCVYQHDGSRVIRAGWGEIHEGQDSPALECPSAPELPRPLSSV